MSRCAGKVVIEEAGGVPVTVAAAIAGSVPRGLIAVAAQGRMFASCRKCGARSATFSRGPGGDIRARRWETQHRCAAEPRR